MQSKRRVVVTGLGLLSALGQDTRTTWKNILHGQSAVTSIQSFDASQFTCQISASIPDFVLGKFKTQAIHKMDLFIQYGMQAAKEAILDSNLDLNALNKERVGVSIGSGMGGIASIEKQHLSLIKAQIENKAISRAISPFFVPGSIVNMVSGICAIEYGFQGPNFSVNTACATGMHNIGLGARSIAYNEADVMLVGGAEMATTPLSVSGFSACRALSRRNDDPQGASRPWDQTRDGFVLADGAAILVLEEYEQARARNAPIYAECLGFGMSADAYDITAPSLQGEGASLAMRHALKDAMIEPEAIDYVNAHATSTCLGDIAELEAIKHIFSDHIKTLKISSTKSMTGHLLGAAGAIEAIFCILALRDQVAPATINLNQPDKKCRGFNLVPHHAQPTPMNVALSNSFGFGGTNASLILGRV